MTAEALTTTYDVLMHVKSHLIPELEARGRARSGVELDHLTDYDVRCIAGLTLHAITFFGLTVVPTSSGETARRTAPPLPLEVGRIEPSVPVAANLLVGALWRSSNRGARRVAEWLDARLETYAE